MAGVCNRGFGVDGRICSLHFWINVGSLGERD